MRDLRSLFAPRSVAVIGAGERPTSSGGAVMQMLRRSGYAGRVVPVNPRGGTIFGIEAARSAGELAEPADLAVVAIGPERIVDAVREAAGSGHRTFLVLPGGFGEAGEAGRARDAELRELARAAGLTIAGPNCAGLIHLDPAGPLAATFLRDLPSGPRPGTGGIALISQSGALAEEVIAKANAMGLPLMTVVSVGNGMHLAVEDYLDHLGAQPSISCVLIYAESFADAERFQEVARRVSAAKPVVALVGGRTQAGARAVAAHTGGTAGSDAETARFLAQCGVIRVRSLRRLLLAAKGFGTFPRGIGRRVLVLSNSGGPGVLCTDRCAVEGLELPALPGPLAASLRAALPPEASVANPLDLLADAREDRFGAAADAVIAEAADAYDAILGLHVVPFMVDAAPVVARLAAAAARWGKPMLHCMMGTLEHRQEWFAELEAAGIAAFDDAESMAECAGLLARRNGEAAGEAAGGATGGME
ncbi:CoA-binding protein [Arenibaculum sp.]|uniref:CoA-binding protein n=1 Tax=Arenibaculum sp. TaxID=2865862 RepID=UPI002E152BF7|nr:CoA-binding protein [Arenibaculum sp.]